MIMIKKFLALSVCLTLSLSILSACSSKDGSSAVSSADDSNAVPTTDENISVQTSLVIDGEYINTDGLVMCTVDGFDISFDEFRYYWLSYYDYLLQVGYDAENSPDEMLDLIKYNVLNDLTDYYSLIGMARDNSLDYMVTGEELQTAYMYQIMNYPSEKDYYNFLVANNLTDSALQSTLACYLAYDMAYDELFGDDGALAIDNDTVLEAFQTDEMARCVHILIPFSAAVTLSEEDMEGWDELGIAAKYNKLETAYNALEDSKKEEVKQKSLELAEEVLAKAQAGEDFFSLIEQYNYDLGMEPEENQSYSEIAGYYFTKDYSYVQEFIDGTFALQENEISPIVTSEDYGYHIIMRLPVDVDYVNENIDDLADEYNQVNAALLYGQYRDNVDVTFSEYFDMLTLDSIK